MDREPRRDPFGYRPGDIFVLELYVGYAELPGEDVKDLLLCGETEVSDYLADEFSGLLLFIKSPLQLFRSDHLIDYQHLAYKNAVLNSHLPPQFII